MHRNSLHFYTLTIRNQKEKLRKQSHSPLQQKGKKKKKKTLRINLPMETKDCTQKTIRH